MNPAADTAHIRKARPPRSFVSPARFGDDHRLRCTVSYDPSNGHPLRAILLPIVLHRGRWCLARGAQAVEHPGAADIAAPLAEVAPSIDDLATAEVRAPWPDGARQALLLLLHAQLDAIGDDQDQVDVEGALQARRSRRMAAACRVAAECLNTTWSGDLERGVVTRRAPDAAGLHGDGSGHDDGGGGGGEGDRGDGGDERAGGIGFALAGGQVSSGPADAGVRSAPLALATGSQDLAIGPAEAALWRLAQAVQDDPAIAFTLLVGSQVTVGDGRSPFHTEPLADRLALAYERLRVHKGLQRLLRLAGHAVYPLLDDGEVFPRWEPPPDGCPPEVAEPGLETAGRGKAAYLRWQRPMWPDPALPPDGALWRSTTLGGHAFFLADTRTERRPRSAATVRAAWIIGPGQADALRNWLVSAVVATGPAFVVTPAAFLPRRLTSLRHPGMALLSDAWDGYPAALHAMLAGVCDANPRHLVFLSRGDGLPCVAQVEVACESTGRSVTFHSIHAPPLYAPDPSSNATAADFAECEQFAFEHAEAAGGAPRRYRCTVKAEFPAAGDGFVLLRTTQRDGRWQLRVAFERVDGGAPAQYAPW